MVQSPFQKCAAWIPLLWYIAAALPFCCPVHADELRIGLLTELTGSEAPNGKACRLGYETAARLFERDPALRQRVRLLYGDHRAEPATALSEYKRLYEVEGISVLLANRGPIGMALEPVTRRDHLPFLGISGHVGFIKNNPYGFRLWVPAEQDGRRLAELVQARGLKRAAIVALYDDYILALVAEFRAHFEKLGGQVSYFDTVEKTVADFSPIVARIKSSNPDVIFANGSVAQIGLLIRKIRESGLQQQIISNFWAGYPDVISSAGVDAIEGTVYVGIDTRRPKFQEQAAEIDPQGQITSVTYACYAALGLVYDMLRRHPEVRDKEGLYQALLQTSEIDLPDEKVPLIHREAIFALVPYVIHDGRPVIANSATSIR